MRSTYVLITLAMAMLTLLAGCGSGAAPSPTAASAAPTITLLTNPSPPQSGSAELVATVSDPSGQPLDGADVFIFADHTEMSGMSMNGKATAQGNGRYAVTANLGMGGKWKVTVQVKKAPLDFAQDFNLNVE